MWLKPLVVLATVGTVVNAQVSSVALSLLSFQKISITSSTDLIGLTRSSRRLRPTPEPNLQILLQRPEP